MEDNVLFQLAHWYDFLKYKDCNFFPKFDYRIYSFYSPGPYFFQPNSLPGPYSNGPLFKHGRLLFSK